MEALLLFKNKKTTHIFSTVYTIFIIFKLNNKTFIKLIQFSNIKIKTYENV